MLETVDVKLFAGLLTPEAKAHVAAGGLAVEKWDKSYTQNGPLCFRGRDFIKVYGNDAEVLRRLALHLGVRVVKVDRLGRDGQHVDLCGKPMRMLLSFLKEVRDAG